MYEHTESTNVFEMNKKCVFLFCALSIVQTKSDNCSDDFLKCLSEFADSFFQNISEIEHVNVSENIPEGFKQVKDVELKTIQELTQSVQDELFKRLQSHAVNDAVVVTDNPKTKIFVKTFSHYFEDRFIPDSVNIDLESDENGNGEVKNYQAFTPIEVQENDDKDSTQLTVINQFPGDIVTMLNRYNEDENQKAITEEKNHSLAVQITNLNKDDKKTKVIEETSTPSAETSVDNRYNDEKEQVSADHSSLTTKIIDNTQEINKPEQKTTDRPLTTTLSTKNKVKEGLVQKDLAKKQSDTNNNNETSHTTPNTLEDSSIPNHSAQNILTEKQFEKDIRENIIQTDDDNDYDIEDATDYPQIDYIDLYKDTTNEENVYVPTDSPKSVIDIKDEIVENVEEYSLEIDTELDNDTSTNICHGNTSDVSNIFPWIATIFIKNDSVNNQFQYTCDGALLGDKVLITAARCVILNNSTVSPDDVLVFLGKRSLQNSGDGERNARVTQIKLHNNFTNEDGKINNDLALLVLEEPITLKDTIRPACLGGEGDVGKSATTAWDITGALKPVFFEKNKNENCNEQNDGDGTFCATYGNAVALCPSYGGVHASRRASRWYLDGIRSGDPGDRGLCFDKTVRYTSIFEHLEWIMENME